MRDQVNRPVELLTETLDAAIWTFQVWFGTLVDFYIPFINAMLSLHCTATLWTVL